MGDSKRTVQTYPVRASHRRNLELEALAAIARNHFESVAVDGGEITATYGAIERLAARPDGKELAVTVQMNPKVPNEVAAATIARFNGFLQDATGYSSKERAKRLRKSPGA